MEDGQFTCNGLEATPNISGHYSQPEQCSFFSYDCTHGARLQSSAVTSLWPESHITAAFSSLFFSFLGFMWIRLCSSP